MKLTADQLQRAAGISDDAARLWLAPVNLAGAACNLTTAVRWAMWIAQCGHESASFTRLQESLNYTPEGLMATWPKRYTLELARAHGRSGTKPADQKAIANHVYGGRLGNRPGTDDGWAFIGRGVLQITGRDNYKACGDHLGVDLLRDPAMLANDRRMAAESTAWYWDVRHLNDAADIGDVEGATRVINGGTNGLEDRKRRYARALAALGADAGTELRRIGSLASSR